MPRSIGIGLGVNFGGAPIVAAAFTPTDISGLSLWLDASDTTSITESGGAVSQINDLSGNARHFTQATGADQPTTGSVTIGGLNALSFDGSSDQLKSSSTSLVNASDGTFTLFVVALPDVVNVTQTIMNADPEASARPPQFLLIASTASATGIRISNFAGSLSVVQPSKSSVSSGVASVFSSRLSTSDYFIAVNGTRGTALSAAGGATAASKVVSIGRDPVGSPGRPFDGAIGEVIVYAASLSDADMGEVETYLTSKWGL
jgi:hypothetical protein